MKTKQKNYESQFLINSILKGEYDKIYIYIYIYIYSTKKNNLSRLR
jgi:hypothetical protein